MSNLALGMFINGNSSSHVPVSDLLITHPNQQDTHKSPPSSLPLLDVPALPGGSVKCFI